METNRSAAVIEDNLKKALAELLVLALLHCPDYYALELSHRAKTVLFYLKDHADSEGKCWPGIRTIAAELGLSRSTVKRALDDLVKG